jgi:S-adenosylmethionine hydrolase
MSTGRIITLTTDFGLTDFYVAAMKSVLLYFCPGACLIDITHQIDRHDLSSGSFTLERAVSVFAQGSIHLAVVDPGVGSDRRMLVAQVNNSFVICPDNGLITWAWRNYPGSTARELTWRSTHTSNTFHGRDVMAPVAGQIAAGYSPWDFTGEEIDPILFDMHIANGPVGQVIHIDHFGNATTNIPAANLTGMTGVHVGDNKIILRRTYADVAIGEPIALIGSSDLLEIAIRNGSAADNLKLNIGDPISIL